MLGYMAHVSIELFNVPQALESGHRALELAEEIEDRVVIANSQNWRRSIHYILGNYEQAIGVGVGTACVSDEIGAEGLGKGVLGVIPWFLPQSYAEVGRVPRA